jgi:hypothetical protein
MIAWLKWLLCRRELEELDRWRIGHYECKRWFGQFPDVDIALDQLGALARGEGARFHHDVRDDMRRLRAISS